MTWAQRLFLTIVMFGFSLIPLSFLYSSIPLMLLGIAMLGGGFGLEYHYEERNSW